ncbi:hypothetical protein FRB95_012049 [Tulasnella sp. JGI-2019a]|nr:hypothetical protein FRB95_012049 [Tulasnella sp. JGI-2019a]
MNEELSGLSGRSTPFDVAMWYTDGRHLRFNRLCSLLVRKSYVSSKGQGGHVLIQGFRPGSIQLPIAFELTQSVVLVVKGTVEGSKQIKGFQSCILQYGEKPDTGLREICPPHFTSVPRISSVTVEISQKETGYHDQF